MQVEFQEQSPCQDWQAVARMLACRPDLPGDVTLVVGEDRLCFVDSDGELLKSLPPGQWTGTAITDIETMLDLLSWIETSFVEPIANGRFGCPVRGWRRLARPVH